MRSDRSVVAALVFVVAGIAGIAGSERAALADDRDPPKCIITKVKDADVSIDIPLRGTLVSEVHCRNDATKAAKEYAKEHQTCDPKKKMEKTFKYTLDFGPRKAPKTATVMASCPK